MKKYIKFKRKMKQFSKSLLVYLIIASVLLSQIGPDIQPTITAYALSSAESASEAGDVSIETQAPIETESPESTETPESTEIPTTTENPETDKTEESEEELIEGYTYEAETEDFQEYTDETTGETITVETAVLLETVASEEEFVSSIEDYSDAIDYSILSEYDSEMNAYIMGTSEYTYSYIKTPTFANFDVDKTDNGVFFAAEIDDDLGKTIREVGFVYTTDNTDPSISNTVEIIAIDSENADYFWFLLEDIQETVYVRGYVIYDEMINYTQTLSSNNSSDDGVVYPTIYAPEGVYKESASEITFYSYETEEEVVYQSSGEETETKNNLADVGDADLELSATDSDGVYKATYLYEEGTGIKEKLWGSFLFPAANQVTFNLDYDPQYGDTVHLILYGKFVAVPTLWLNGVSIGVPTASTSNDYYVIEVNQSLLNKGENTLTTIIPMGTVGYAYLDNMQILFNEGPGSEFDEPLEIVDVDVQSYNLDKGFLGILYLDFEANITTSTGDLSDTYWVVNAINMGGNIMNSSYQETKLIEGENQTYFTTSSFKDDAVFESTHDLYYYGMIIGETVFYSNGSDGLDQMGTDVVLSLGSDKLTYVKSSGPLNFALDADYYSGYYSVAENGPLAVTLNVDSVFGKAMQGLYLPSANYDATNKADTADDGIVNGMLERLDDMVAASNTNVVYNSSQTVYIESNGTYQIKVKGELGYEYLTFTITNIDNVSPSFSMIGGDTIVMYEGYYTDMGFGGADNRTIEEDSDRQYYLNGEYYDYYTTNSDGELDPFSIKLGIGEYKLGIIYKDEAGNLANASSKLYVDGVQVSAIRTITVVSGPLALDAADPTVSDTKVTFYGEILSSGNDEILERGLVWDITSSPTVSANLGKYIYSKDETSFSTTLDTSSMIYGATYYVRAYATTANGTTYSNTANYSTNGLSYGSFSITSTKSVSLSGTATLTISRASSDGEQIVSWRTVDGTAIAGTHYTANSGSLTFKDGEKSKTISISILNPTSETARIWEITNRQFFVEIYNVYGGATISSSDTCTVTISENDTSTIQRTSFGSYNTVSQNQPWSSYTYSDKGNVTIYSPSSTGYDLTNYAYWGYQGEVGGKFSVYTNMKSADTGLYMYKKTTSSSSWALATSNYWNSGDTTKTITSSDSSLTGKDYVRVGIYLKNGTNLAKITASSPTLSIKYSDTKTPTISSISAKSATYGSGDTVYVNVYFSEIVTVDDSTKTNLTVKFSDSSTTTATYVAGSGTDVFTYKFTIPDGKTSSGITVTTTGSSTAGIKDFVSNKVSTEKTTTLSGINIQSSPYTAIAAKQTTSNDSQVDVKVTVSASNYTASLQSYSYAFSTDNYFSSDVLSSLKEFSSGEILSLGGGTGTYYLHVYIEDSLGTYKIANIGEYTINNDNPSFEISKEEVWKTSTDGITVTLDFADDKYKSTSDLTAYLIPDSTASVTYDNIASYIADSKKYSSITLSGDSTSTQKTFKITENGSYVVYVVDKSSGNGYFDRVTIETIDNTVPTISMYASSADYALVDTAITSDTLMLTSDTAYAYTAFSHSINVSFEDSEAGLDVVKYAITENGELPTDSNWKDVSSSLSGGVFTVDFGSTAGTFDLYVSAVDAAGNTVTYVHKGFTIKVNTPPTITAVIQELQAGYNVNGVYESTVLDAAAISSGISSGEIALTARTVFVKVVATVNATNETMLALALPTGEVVYNGNTNGNEDVATITIDGYTVEDTDSSDSTITIMYPVTSNGLQTFIAMDTADNIAINEDSSNIIVVNAIDRNAPVVEYFRYNAETDALISSSDWVSAEDGIKLDINVYDNTKTSVYDSYGEYSSSTGVGGGSYSITYNGEAVSDSVTSFTLDANGTYQVTACDDLGNTTVKNIVIENIDTYSPFVETNGVAVGVISAETEISLIFSDVEMGIVNEKYIAITNDTTTINADEMTATLAKEIMTAYDGSGISFDSVGTYYIYYYAEDEVGHNISSYFGPYIIDETKPVIEIDSSTADTYILTGDVTEVVKSNNYARLHSATVTVDFPSAYTSETIQYQWSTSQSPSAFSWVAVKATDITEDSTDDSIITFETDSSAIATSGVAYLHIQTEGVSSYRAFYFDFDLPTISIIGGTTVSVSANTAYTDLGATATDDTYGSVAVSTVVDGEDTALITVSVMGTYVITYTATDGAGNTATAQRIVNVVDNTNPVASNIARETTEDTTLAFTFDDFYAAYDDGINYNSNYEAYSTFTKIKIASLPIKADNATSAGDLRLNGALLTVGSEISIDQLASLEFYPAENYYGDCTFTFTAFDSVNESAAATVSIAVAPVNDIPTAAEVNKTMYEDTTLVIDLTDYIADVETSDSNLVITVDDIDVTKFSTTNVTTDGTATVSGQKITYTPDENFNGSVIISYTVTDTGKDSDSTHANATSSNHIYITVNNVNDSPFISATVSVDEDWSSDVSADNAVYMGGQDVKISWSAAASDVDNDALTYNIYYVRDGEETRTQIASGVEATEYIWQVASINGVYYIEVEAIDPSNTVSETMSSKTAARSADNNNGTFIVDSTAPTVNTFDPDGKAWGKASIAVAVSATDAKQTDVEENENSFTMQYRIATSTDGANYTYTSWTYVAEEVAALESGATSWTIADTDEITISKEGYNKLEVRVTDLAGNVSAVKTSEIYYIDTTNATAVEFDVTFGAVDISNSAAYSTSVTIAGSSTDSQTNSTVVSSLTETPYTFSIDSGSQTAAQALGEYTFANLDPDTSYALYMHTTDIAGNVQTDYQTVRTLAGDVYGVTLTKWSSSTLTFEISDDNPSTTSYTAWLVADGGSQEVGSQTVTFADSETKEISFSGLAEDTIYKLYIQTTNGGTTEVGAQTTNAAVSFEVGLTNTSDQFKTNDKINLTIDSQNVTQYYSAVEARNIITFTGAVEDLDINFYGKDAIPTVVVSFVDGDNTYTATATLEELEISGLANWWYNITGSTTQTTKWTWRATFDVAGTSETSLKNITDGAYSPTVSATDNANESVSDSYANIYIDTNAPVALTSGNAETDNIYVSDTAATSSAKYTNASSVSVVLKDNGDTYLTEEKTDDVSLVKTIRYSLSGAQTKAFTEIESPATITITNEGVTTITLEVEDNAGNVTSKTQDIYIDRTSPVYDSKTETVSYTDSTKTDVTYDASWVSGSIKVALTTTDNVGLASVSYIVTDNTTAITDTTKYTNSFTYSQDESVVPTITLQTNQINYIHYLFEDTAGNTQTYVAGPYKIDTTAPAPVFTVPDGELIASSASEGSTLQTVILKSHSAVVDVYDYNNIFTSVNSNASESHVSGLAKSEYIWLPTSVPQSDLSLTETSVTVGATTTEDDLPNDDATGAYSWAEFTSGNNIVQGGEIDGNWNLWIRLTDTAGNVAVYNQQTNNNHSIDKDLTDSDYHNYLYFRFDNQAPNMMTYSEVLAQTESSNSWFANSETVGSLDLSLEVDDDSYYNSNSGLEYYQYTFTTVASSSDVDESTLDSYKFISYRDFLVLDGETTITLNTGSGTDITDDINSGDGFSIATQFAIDKKSSSSLYHEIISLDGTNGTLFGVAISDLTGAIVITDSDGTTKTFSGEYNDGMVHEIVVSADFDNSLSGIKVYVDGSKLGTFWFGKVDISSTNAVSSVTMGENFHGTIFTATMFAREVEDYEGKAFAFETTGLIADFVFADTFNENITTSDDDATKTLATTVTLVDFSGQENNATVDGSVVGDWTGEYQSGLFLDTNGKTTIDLSAYIAKLNNADAFTIATTFQTETATTTQTIVDLGSNGITIAVDTSGYLTATLNGSDVLSGQNLKVADGNIHTVYISMDKESYSIYLDGDLKKTAYVNAISQFKSITTATAAVNVSGGEFFDGTLYNIHMFSRALGYDEITSGNISYLSNPIAILNFAESENKTVSSFSSYKAAAEGMTFSDYDDAIDIGTGISDAGLYFSGESDFTVSARFDVDDSMYYTDGYTETGSDKVGGMIISFTSGTSTYFALQISDTGTEEIMVATRCTEGTTVVRKRYFSTPGIYSGEHYVTVSYDDSTCTLTVYYDGEYVGEVCEYSVGDTEYTLALTGGTTQTQGYIGVYNYLGATQNDTAQFFGTIYNINIKSETTSLETHIEETLTNTVVASTNNLVANYVLTETGIDSTSTYPSTAPTVSGLGDAYISVSDGTTAISNGGITLTADELKLSSGTRTVELIVSADSVNTNGVGNLMNFSGSTYIGFKQTAGTDTTETSDDVYGYFVKDGDAITSVYTAEFDEQVRLTVVFEPTVSSTTDDVTTVTAANIYFYANGNYVGMVSGVTIDDSSNKIGPSDNAFNGKYYDVKTWNTTLTAAQIAESAAYDKNTLTSHYDFATLDSYDALTSKVGITSATTDYTKLTQVSTKTTDYLYGMYPELDGTSNSYFTTPVGTIDFDSSFRIVMSFEKLESNVNDGASDTTAQTFFGVRETNSSASSPLFIYDNGSAGTLFSYYGESSTNPTLYTSSGGLVDIDFTVNITSSGVIDSVKNNIANSTLSGLSDITPNSTNGQLIIGGRDYAGHNGHMILYSMKVYQSDVLILEYDGTRDAEGNLIDVSGSTTQYNATPANSSSVNWVTNEAVISQTVTEGSISVPSDATISWVENEVAAGGDDLIYMTNVEVQGVVYVHVWVSDALGNVTEQTYGPFDYDTTSPEVSVVATLGDEDSTTNIAPANVTIAVSDNWYLGTATTSDDTTKYNGIEYGYCEVSGEVSDPSSLTYSDGATIQDVGMAASYSLSLPTISGSTNLADNKCYYVKVVATDWLGNSTTQYLYVSQDTLIVDKTVPTISAVVINDGVWETTKYVYVEVADEMGTGSTETDASGINASTLKYAWSTSATTPDANDSSWTSFENYSKIAKTNVTGTQYLHLSATDNVGNTQTACITVANFDNTAPTVAVASSNTDQTKAESMNLNISITAEDSSIDSGKYTIVSNEGLSLVANSENSYIVTANGEYNFTITDAAGNSTTKSITVANFDRTAPTVAINNVVNGYTSETINASVSYSDNVAVSSATYQITNGTTTSGDISGNSIEISQNGTNVLTVTVEDAAGNSATATQTYYIDKAENGITISEDSTASAKSHTATVTITDTTAGAAKNVYYAWVVSGGDVSDLTSATLDSSNQFQTTLDGVTGSYFLYVKTVSQTGVENGGSSSAMAFNNTAPTVLDSDITISETDWTNKDVIITFASLITDKITCSESLSVSGNVFTATENGTYTFTIEDSVGNATVKEIVIDNIDKTNPTIQDLKTSGSSVTSWSVTTTASDEDGGSGLASLVYYVSADSGSSYVKYNDVAITATGAYKVYAVATDNAGNTATSATTELTLDKESLGIAYSYGENYASVQKSQEISVTVSKTTYSTIDEVEYVWSTSKTTPENGWTAVSTSETDKVEFSASVDSDDTDGTYYLHVKATSNQSIVASGVSAGVTIDNTTPTIADSDITISETDWTNQDIKISIQAETGATVALKGDTSSPALISPFTITENGTYTFTITDSAGNSSEKTVAVSNIDKIAPTFGDFAAVGAINTGWNVSIAASDEENGSGLASLVYYAKKSTDESYLRYYDVAVLSNDGTYEVYAVATDNAGNSTTSETAKYTIDKTAPELPIITQNSGSNFVFDISNIEEGATLEYTLNGGTTWIAATLNADKITATIDLTSSISTGSYTLEVRATDENTNVSDTQSYKFTIDATAPVISIESANSDWTKESVKVSVKATDETAIQSVGYYISSVEITDFTSVDWVAISVVDSKLVEKDITITNEGSFYIYAYVQDMSQTVYSAAAIVKIDKTAPVISASASDIASGGYKVSVSASEESSSATLAISVDGEDKTSSIADGAITVSGLEGNMPSSVVITATDTAGNQSTQTVSVVTLAAKAASASITTKTAKSATVTIVPSANYANAEYIVSITDSNNTYKSSQSTSYQAEFALDADWEITNITVETFNSAGVSSGTISETISVKASYVPVLAVTSVDNTTVYKADSEADGEIVISGTISDDDKEDIYITATIDNIAKSVMVDTSVDSTWKLSWDITDDNVCASTFGTFDVVVSASDAGGNTVAASAGKIYVDNQGPSAPTFVASGETLSGEVDLGTVAANSNGSYVIDFAAGVDNGAAGVYGYVYTINSTKFTNSSKTDIPADISLTTDGRYTITAYYIDKNGNSGDTTTVVLNLDTAAPEIETATLEMFSQETGAWVEVTKSDDSWYTGDLRFSAAADEESATVYMVVSTEDVAASDFNFDGASENLESASEYLENAVNYVYVKVVDEVGNASYAKYGAYSIDNDGVEISIDVDTLDISQSNSGKIKLPTTSTDEAGAEIESVIYAWSSALSYTDIKDEAWTKTTDIDDWNKDGVDEIPIYEVTEPDDTDEYGIMSVDDEIVDGDNADDEVDDAAIEDVIIGYEYEYYSYFAVATPAGMTDGNYFLYAISTDAAGNQYVARSSQITVDVTAPTITIAQGSDVYESASSITASGATITIDVEFSDIAAIVRSEYLFDETAKEAEDFTDELGESVGEYIVNGELLIADNGVYSFYAQDEAGNESVAYVTISGLDAEAPTISGSAESEWITTSDLFEFTFEDNATIAKIGYIDAANDSSYNNVTEIDTVIDSSATALDETIFKTVDVNAQSYTFTVGFNDSSADMNITADGTVYLHFAVIDMVGNITYQSFGPYNTDTTIPTIDSVTADVTDWTNGTVSLTVVASDNLSGIQDTPFSYDGGLTWVDDDVFEFDKNQDVSIQVIDMAGNKSTVTVYSIENIDIDSPVISDIKAEESAWINQNIEIAYSVADVGVSGISKVEITTEDGNIVSFDEDDNSFVVGTNGTYVITATDNVCKIVKTDSDGNSTVETITGNTTSESITITNIDKALPTVVSVAQDETIWVNDSVTLTVTASDDASGISTYSFDGGTTWQEDNYATFTKNATISIYVKDIAGSVSELFQHDIVNIDTTYPTIYDVVQDVTAHTNQTVTVTFATADEGGSTIDSVKVSTENGVIDDWDEDSFEITTNGTYVITVEDVAGNITTKDVVIENIDNTAPTVSINNDFLTTWVGTLPELSITSADDPDSIDAESGVDASSLVLHVKDEETLYSSIEVAGTYYIVATIEDKAQNSTTSESVTIKLEPDIQIFVDGMDGLTSESDIADLLIAQAIYDSMTGVEQSRLQTNVEANALYKELQEWLTAAQEELEEAYAEAEAAKEQNDLLASVAEALLAAYESTSTGQKETAIALYDALTQNQKELFIEKYQDDNSDVDAYDVYELMIEDLAAVYAVVDMIDAIKTPYSPSTIELITAAGEAYAALTEAQQAMFPTTTYAKYEILEELATSATAVQEMIDVLTSESSLADVKAVISEYEDLSENAQAMVSGIDTVYGYYNSILDAMEDEAERAAEESAQRVTAFEKLVASVYLSPTIDDVTALEAAYAALTSEEQSAVSSGVLDKYNDLLDAKADAEEFNALLADENQTITDIINAHETLSYLAEMMADEVLYGAMVSADIVENLIAALPDHLVGEDCEDEDCDITQHISSVEITKFAYELLSQTAREFVSDEYVSILNEQYDALLSYYNYINTKESESTSVEVVGIVENIVMEEIIKVEEAAQEYADKLTAEIEASKELESDEVINITVDRIVEVMLEDSQPVVLPKTETTATEPMLSADIYLSATIDVVKTAYSASTLEITSEEIIESYNLRVSLEEDKKMAVKVALPSGYDLETLEIHHVHDDGTSELITEFELIESGNIWYAVYQVDDFSHFVFYAEEIVYESSGGSSLPTLNVAAPTITESGNVVTISDTVLSFVTINGEEIEIVGNEMVLDLSSYGNGTYEIVAKDQYGNTTTKTVVVTGVDSDNAPSATTAPTQTQTPDVQESESESGNGFPWWILIVIAACVAGYVVYKKRNQNK